MKLPSLLLLAVTLFPLAAGAGPFTDEMSRCLVKNTSETDKELLIKWVFAAMAAHPKVKSLSNVSTEQGDRLNKETADLMVTLLVKRCKAETEQALKAEGASTFQASFQVLGQVAMQGLMTNPDVAQYMAGLEPHLDTKALEKAFGRK